MPLVQDMPDWQHFLAFWVAVAVASAAVTILAARLLDGPRPARASLVSDDMSCDTGICGSEAPPLIGERLTGTGFTLAQAAAALERGETPALSPVQHRIVEDWAAAR